MGWFDWLKRKELRRIEYLEKQLKEKRKEAADYWFEKNSKDHRMFNILAHINVSMQGGEEWAKVFNEVVESFNKDEQVGVRQATLELMHRFQLEGKNLNMIQHPVFEFPERVIFPNGTEVMGLKPTTDDNTWWKEHSGR